MKLICFFSIDAEFFLSCQTYANVAVLVDNVWQNPLP